MSQPPFLNYPNAYVQQPQVPRPVMVLSIIGIVFGSLGVLCLGSATLFQGVAMMNPQWAKAVNQQASSGQPIQLAFAIVGLALSTVLLGGAVGSLRLNNWGRVLLLRWAVVDIIYDTAKLVLTFVIVIPQMSSNPAFQQHPQTQQIASFVKIATGVFAVIIWFVTVVYPVLILVYFRQPEIVHVFGQEPGAAPT